MSETDWPPYHWLDSPDIESIMDDFWCPKYDEKDLSMYRRFLEILELSKDGLNGDAIGRSLGVNNVRKYLTGNKMSFLTRLRTERDRLGAPVKGTKWIPMRMKPRGIPEGPWIQGPSPVTFGKVNSMIPLLPIVRSEPSFFEPFGFSSLEDMLGERVNMLGFLLGAMIGDAGKHPKGSSHFNSMSLSLVLSQGKLNSFRFGEYASLCAKMSLGLEMHRISDAPASENRFTNSDCFRWISQASPLVGWLFHECLGLNWDELTTYDSLKIGWLMEAPPDFKANVLQGICESDGWVDASSDDVCFVSSPNSALFLKVLQSIGSSGGIDQQAKVEVLRVPTEEASKIPLFSPRVRSVYFERMKVMSEAHRLPPTRRVSPEVVAKIRELSQTYGRISEVCYELARLHGVKVSSQTVRKYGEFPRSL